MIVRGVNWSDGWRGTFFSPRFTSGHQLFVAGKRGDWVWRVHYRPPPATKGEAVAEGKASTKIAAMAAAVDAMRLLTLPKGLPQ